MASSTMSAQARWSLCQLPFQWVTMVDGLYCRIKSQTASLASSLIGISPSGYCRKSAFAPIKAAAFCAASRCDAPYCSAGIVGEPLSPNERLSKEPCPPKCVATATGAPMAKKASPGCAAIAITFEKPLSCPPEFSLGGCPGNCLAFKDSASIERALHCHQPTLRSYAV